MNVSDEEEEAEYAWLSPGSLKPFQAGELSGRDDGMESQDHVLRASVAAAHKSIKTAEQMLSQWGSDNEDSDGGESIVLEVLMHHNHDRKELHHWRLSHGPFPGPTLAFRGIVW